MNRSGLCCCSDFRAQEVQIPLRKLGAAVLIARIRWHATFDASGAGIDSRRQRTSSVRSCIEAHRATIDRRDVSVGANSSTPTSYDVVVLGGGAAGLTAALAARHEGASVALVERERRIGGDCTFHGCVPSKALIDVAQVVHDARLALAAGTVGGELHVDFARVSAYRAAVVNEVARDERDERFLDVGIAVHHGDSTVLGRHEITVGGRAIRTGRIVIATGADPAVPPIPGLASVPYLTNRTIFSLDRLPARLVVLGGGPTGLELAQAFRRLGSDVAVVELERQLLPAGEPETSSAVAALLASEGIDVRLGARAAAVEVTDGEITIELTGSKDLRCDALLVATGRRAVLPPGADVLGLRLDRGSIVIDQRCRTSVKGVYAAGDVTGGMLATHVAAHEGSVAGRNATGARARVDRRVVPAIVFLDPEVARVGITEAQARQERRGVVAVTFPMARVDRARIAGRTTGFVKLVTARRSVVGRLGGGEIVGAEIVGYRAGELVHEVALAMRTRMFAGRLAQMIHAYPAASVAVQQAAAQLYPLGRLLADRSE